MKISQKEIVLDSVFDTSCLATSSPSCAQFDSRVLLLSAALEASNRHRVEKPQSESIRTRTELLGPRDDPVPFWRLIFTFSIEYKEKMPEAKAAPRAANMSRNKGGAYVDRDKPAQIRFSNISAAKGAFKSYYHYVTTLICTEDILKIILTPLNWAV